jgi:hypothetical protein
MTIADCGPEETRMATTGKRIFVSFSSEDARYRDLLLGQARHQGTPFVLVDLSDREAGADDEHDQSEDSDETRRLSRIRDCDGVLALISANTPHARAQLSELRWVFEEALPVLLIFVSEARPRSLPALLKNRRIVAWSWESISNFLKKL